LNSNIERESFEQNLKQSSYKSAVPKSLLKRKPIDWSVQTEKKIALQRVLQELMVNMKNTAKQALDHWFWRSKKI
jgi:hypothetical protein